MLRRIVLGALILAASAPAHAFVHGQLLLGTRQGRFEGGEGIEGESRSTEVQLSVQFDYLEGIPVTLGLFVDTKTYRLRETEGPIDRLWTWSVGPEVMAWLPLWEVVPYAKAGIGFGEYMAMEAGKSREHSARAHYSAFSRRYSAGVKWDRNPAFQPLIDYQILTDELTAERATPGLMPIDKTIQSGAVLVGFETAY